MPELETLPNALEELLTLDDAPGPALPLSQLAAARVVDQTLQAASTMHAN